MTSSMLKTLAMALAIPAMAVAQNDSSPRRLNVLMIAVDDLKPALGCYGDAAAHSPNIDRLAARGTLFEKAYCQQAVCSPTRTSLLTGRRPDTTRVYDLQTHFRNTIPDVVTLPEHFKKHGYHTQGLSKIYHGGLDDPASWSVPHWTPKAAGNGPKGRELLQDLRAKARARGLDLSNRQNQPRGYAWEDPDVSDSDLADGNTTDHAIELLHDFKSTDQPFFLAVGLLKPHLPFVAPRKYWDLIDPEKLPRASRTEAPKDAPDYAMSSWGELRAYYGMPKQGPVSAEQERQLLHGYYACVAYIDAQIGRLLDALESSGLADSTVVLLWGDHGWHLGDHGLWCKHTNYEQATHSTLLMRVPGQSAPGGKTTALVEFVDIYPTLVEICRLPSPSGLEGDSFAKLLDDPDSAPGQVALSQYPRNKPGTGRVMGYALRDDRYRLVEWQTPSGECVDRELYDYETDPEESTNLAQSPAHAEIVEKLSVRLKTERGKTKTPN